MCQKFFCHCCIQGNWEFLGQREERHNGSAVSLFMISWQNFDSKLQRTCKLHHSSAPSPIPSPLARLSAASSRSCSHVRFGLWFRRHPSWTFHVLSSQFEVAQTKTAVISCILLSKYSCCFETAWLTFLSNCHSRLILKGGGECTIYVFRINWQITVFVV